MCDIKQGSQIGAILHQVATEVKENSFNVGFSNIFVAKTPLTSSGSSQRGFRTQLLSAGLPLMRAKRAEKMPCLVHF